MSDSPQKLQLLSRNDLAHTQLGNEIMLGACKKELRRTNGVTNILKSLK